MIAQLIFTHGHVSVSGSERGGCKRSICGSKRWSYSGKGCGSSSGSGNCSGKNWRVMGDKSWCWSGNNSMSWCGSRNCFLLPDV